MSAHDLLSAAAVRSAAHRMLNEALDGQCVHWTVDLDHMQAVADDVAATTRLAYPDLIVPLHARWRHFEVGGGNRWTEIESQQPWSTKIARARAAFDLAIISVLLDAGSGGQWRWHDLLTGQHYRSSEGLALASFALFCSGQLSAISDDPLRVDARRLAAIEEATLVSAFQVSPGNPLVGVSNRAGLLRRLGTVCQRHPDLFEASDCLRPGNLADVVLARAKQDTIPTETILAIVLEALGEIWPDNLVLNGVPLGDSWIYRRWQRNDGLIAQSILPFHKLSQWLTYSLIEPTEAMGVRVTELDRLTGLAEYRNGGLFVDHGVLVPRDPKQLEQSHDVSSAFIVEWRALTVAFLDRLHPLVCERLNKSAAEFPLACLLEGGTWAAGRALAKRKRAGGSSPVRITSDGTIF
jgi:Protein of unknown function (DUF1688)